MKKIGMMGHITEGFNDLIEEDAGNAEITVCCKLAIQTQVDSFLKYLI